jgi:hypothetical protein
MQTVVSAIMGRRDGAAAQLGADLLLDGSEVGVEVDEEPVERA